MSPVQERRRLGAFFFAYFALAGLLAPYLPLWFSHRGLTGAEIGVLVAIGQGMRVVGPNLWGWLADHGAQRIRILRATSVALALSFAGFLVPGGFGWLAAVMFALNFFMTAQMPVAEALVATRLRGDPHVARRYGRLRVWGSIGFVVVVLAAGPLFDRVGIAWAPALGLVLTALLVAAAFHVREALPSAGHVEHVSVRRRLREPRVRWFLASAALMVFAHGTYYSYFSLYLYQLGYSKAAIGVYWVAGVLLEIVFFYTQGRFFARFGIYPLLAASFVLAVLRFALIGELAAWWWVLLVAQLLHAVTFAVHHSASVLLIQRWFGGRAAARGQALYISLAYGVGGTSGALVAAALWTGLGPRAAFLGASLAAALGWWALRQARSADHEAEPRVLAESTCSTPE
jgi:PPP family 3-phenylpropionic acid transporter